MTNSPVKQRAVVATTNVITLLAGILIGLYLPQLPPVFAQTPKPEIEEIAPIMTVGSAGIGTLLAGRIATDEIAVKGLDLLKLHENILNLLASKPGLFSQADIQGVIDKSRPRAILRMKEPSKPGDKK